MASSSENPQNRTGASSLMSIMMQSASFATSLCGLSFQKTGNHQGLFAFIMLEFPELDMDWNFFESIRTIRNQNSYRRRHNKGDVEKERIGH